MSIIKYKVTILRVLWMNILRTSGTGWTRDTRIPLTIVDKYHGDIYFLIEINNTIVKVVKPRIAWLEPWHYEVNIDQATKSIELWLITMLTLQNSSLEHMK